MCEIWMDSIRYDVPGCYQQIFEPGTYYIILYGAQGGQCDTDVPYGGYSSGILRITSETTYYACVGGKGNNGTSGVVNGGFNGGGDASFGPNSANRYCAAGGGGRSDIRTTEKDLDSVIIVAGGGGGDGSYINITTGGRGGGFIAENGESDEERAGKGATKSEPGTGGYYQGSTDYDETTGKGYPPCSGNPGQKNIGGNAVTTGSGEAGGGGGGYYGGGGAADFGGGGGGSGYISSIFLRGQSGFSNNSGDGSIIIIPNFHYCTPKHTNIYFVYVLVVIYFDIQK